MGSDSNFDQRGVPHFSAWEAKLPSGTPMDLVQRLVFKDAEAYRKFQERHGDRFDCVVEPDIQGALQRGEDVFGARAAFDAAVATQKEADPRLSDQRRRYTDSELLRWLIDEAAGR
jgi:hypothetical protein